MKSSAGFCLALKGACMGLLVLSGVAAISPDIAFSAVKEWERVRTTAKPHRIELAGGSFIEIDVRSSADITYIKSQPSIHLSNGRMNVNLLPESGIAARLSAPQVFVRASEGVFFIANDATSNLTTIGVCQGTVNAFAGKGPGGSNKGTGEFSIAAGEQAIISGDGTIVKEQDDAMDCGV